MKQGAAHTHLGAFAVLAFVAFFVISIGGGKRCNAFDRVPLLAGNGRGRRRDRTAVRRSPRLLRQPLRVLLRRERGRNPHCDCVDPAITLRTLARRVPGVAGLLSARHDRVEGGYRALLSSPPLHPTYSGAGRRGRENAGHRLRDGLLAV
jgi:hypothetical protein